MDREYEIAQIERVLADPEIKVITISGLAGIGKTALATFVARRQIESDRFPGGVIFVDCAIRTSLPNILTAIADVVGIESASLTPGALRDRVFFHLRSAPTLLVFDAYEAVAEDDEVLSFVGRLPKLTKALILTRKKVRVPGREITIRLAPFDDNVALELWRQYLSPEQWAETDKESLRDINRWAGGLPLAVGLVASLLEQGWSLPKILGRLQEGAVPTDAVVERVLEQVDTALTKEQRRLLDALCVFSHPAEGNAIATVAEIKEWRPSSEPLARMSIIEIVDGAYSDENVHEFRACRPSVGAKRR